MKNEKRSRLLMAMPNSLCLCASVVIFLAAFQQPGVAVSAPGENKTSTSAKLRVKGGANSNAMELVDLSTIEPSIKVDIKWAGADNLLKRKAYAENRCWVRRATAEHLSQVQKRLKADGLGLKVWEGYRPMWMQKMLWDEVQNPDLISDPKQGRRVHIRGAAVDVTLVDKDGNELAMPTKYCEFAKHDQMKHSYQQLSAEILKNRKTLRDAMTAEGFQIYENEWWHYDLKNWSEFPIIESDQWVKPAVNAKSKANL